jgi:23S rRNA (guanosine2251-2'-O)-methyltransferase
MTSDEKELVYGRNPVLEVLRAGRRRVFNLMLADGVVERGKIASLLELAQEQGVKVDRLSRRDLDRKSDHHQGVIASVEAYPFVGVSDILDHARDLNEPPLILILDALQNPQNLGTLLRSAEAVGVHGIVLPLRRGVGITSAVASSSSGACEHLRIVSGNIARIIADLKTSDVWFLGLDHAPEAQVLEEIDLSGAVGLVVGNEGSGMRKLVRQACDHLVRIPMRGRVDSLNAAVAGSIALYSIWKARGYHGVHSSGVHPE